MKIDAFSGAESPRRSPRQEVAQADFPSAEKGSPDPFDLDNIRVMVNLLRNDANESQVHEIVELLHRMNLQYNQVLQMVALLRDSMNFDMRTGLLRYQDSYFDNALKNASRILHQSPVPSAGYSLCYARLDIDDFSQYNTRYGHAAGDEVLRRVGETVKATARPTDLCIRYGGEEFDIILTSTPRSGAAVFLDRLQERIRDIRLDVGGGRSASVRASIGVTEISLDHEGIRNLSMDEIRNLRKTSQDRADDALYEAKATGKDRWVLWAPGREAEYRKARESYRRGRTE